MDLNQWVDELFEVFDENRVVGILINTTAPAAATTTITTADYNTIVHIVMVYAFDTCSLLTTGLFQTRDDFLGLVEITLKHATIGTETEGREAVPRDFILRPRR